MLLKKPSLRVLSDAFDAKVIEAHLMPCGFGLSVTLKNPTEIDLYYKGRDPSQNNRRKYKNPALWELTRRYGVVVAENAFIARDGNTVLTGSGENYGLAAQDFYHHDSIFSGEVTILSKEQEAYRKVDTLYVFGEDVRQGIKILNPKVKGRRKGKIEAALNQMIQPDYTFSLDDHEHDVRQEVAIGLPDLTFDLARQIPPQRIYRHTWGAGQERIVMHFNAAQTGILHGRESYGSIFIDEPPKDCLSGLTFGRD